MSNEPDLHQHPTYSLTTSLYVAEAVYRLVCRGEELYRFITTRVDFDDLRSGNRRSGRTPAGSGSGGRSSGGSSWRESRRTDETTGEPRFPERGRDRAADPARLGDKRIPEKHLAEETDEPEDNFGAGLFS